MIPKDFTLPQARSIVGYLRLFKHNEDSLGFDLDLVVNGKILGYNTTQLYIQRCNAPFTSDTLPTPKSLRLLQCTNSTRMPLETTLPRHRIIIRNLRLSHLLPTLHFLQLANLPRPQKPRTYRGSDIHKPSKQLSMQVDVS